MAWCSTALHLHLDLLSDSSSLESLPPVLLALLPLFLASLFLLIKAVLLMLNVRRGHLLSLTRLLHTRLTALVLTPCMLVVESTLVVSPYFLLQNSLLQPSWL